MANKLADWLEALADPDDATREEAAQALIKLADPAATDALIEALEDEYWSVRMHASHALARIGGSRVVEALIPMLGDSIKECRDGAVRLRGPRRGGGRTSGGGPAGRALARPGGRSQGVGADQG